MSNNGRGQRLEQCFSLCTGYNQYFAAVSIHFQSLRAALLNGPFFFCKKMCHFEMCSFRR